MNSLKQPASEKKEVMDYFVEAPDYPNMFKCILCAEKRLTTTPLKLLCGTRKWNLKNHLMSMHKEAYDTLFTSEYRFLLLVLCD